MMYQYAKAGVALGKIYIVFAVLMMFATMWAIYLFPYIARFENQTKMILKNAALIAEIYVSGRLRSREGTEHGVFQLRTVITQM